MIPSDCRGKLPCGFCHQRKGQEQAAPSTSSSSSEAMPSHQDINDLNWALEAIKSGKTSLQSVSFYHQQQTSGAYQETDDSMSIKISTSTDSILVFSQILAALATERSTDKSLQNLEFHGVEWGLEQMQHLCFLVEKNTDKTQLVFRRNNLGARGLSELTEMLRRSCRVRVVIFSECSIGSFGASCLSSALKRNETVEELQIWEDSIGSTGAEELSQMIEVNTTLKQLVLHDTDSVTATPIISAVLARNRTMEVHIWNKESKNVRSKVAEFIPENRTLRVYKLSPSGSQRVACALAWNIRVKTLDMAGVRLSSKWAKEFRVALEQNGSLKSVILSNTCLRDKAVVYVAAGLFRNQSLENLQLDGNWFGGIGVEHLLCPLSRFSALQNQANRTLKSISFGGGRTKIGKEGLAVILTMLETNQTIVRLGIYEDASLKAYDIIRIFRSLERNATLRHLSLKGCKGVEGESVLQAIMETLQVNPWIEEIDLTGTPLQKSGRTEVISQKLGQNERMEHENGLFQNLPQAMPECCRIFFCGQECAGKSTLCNSIVRNLSSTMFPHWDQIRPLVNPAEQVVRREEIKIRTLQDEGIKVSIWVLAGQQEFYTLHDLMFPGKASPSFFLIITSLFRKPDNKEQKGPAEIEEDLLYWLRFIVSNARRANLQSVLPHVTIVLTHSDKLSKHSEDLLPVINSIHGLRERFQGYVEFYSTVFTVDARSSGSVSKLTHHLRKTVKTIIQRVPKVYQLTNNFIKILKDWRSENNNRPAMKWNDFCELCQLKVPALRIRSRHDATQVESQRYAIARSLHDMGEVIFFDELGLLILDCEWLCRDVLSRLIRLNLGRKNLMDRNGFISRKELGSLLRGSLESQIPMVSSKVLENIDAGDLIQMMLRLELCYEQDPGDPGSLLLVPAILEEGRVKAQKWQLNEPECNYVGRHLECDDSSHIFLTASFFPRLQVHLHNRIKSKTQHGSTYSLEKYLISITINGVNIRVELAGQLGHYIDVLACSKKSITEILRLFKQLIIPSIQSLCHGFTLVEKVIRPDSVRYLTPPRHRKNQAVPLQQLKEALLSVPAESMYEYQHTWSSVSDGTKIILSPGFDYARDLLSDDDFRELLQRRYYDLHHLAAELAVPTEQAEGEAQVASNASDQIVEPSLSGIAKGVEAVLQRLKIIEHEIKNLRQEIQGLRYYEHRLLVELHRKVDYMVNYSIQLEERKVPSMFYFVQVEHNSRRLVTRLMSGMTALRLHMLCEFHREMHVVQDQMGCELIRVDNQVVRCLLPYMSTFMKLLTFALKIGAHVVAGMGEIIPDLSREVAHLVNSSLVFGTAAFAAGAVGATVLAGQAAGSRASQRGVPTGGQSSRSFGQDITAAQHWLIGFLKEQRITSGRDIAEKFGLWRVRYLDDGQIAWVCKWHREVRATEIADVPTLDFT
ncbi:hypothetical protein Taro_043256 [Colocasia esculenta]|uniref:C-terminal of Roc COR-B domain-containing protein n=1 Tax=Colocasia esculenta TaxID=4460 RepID=A0A843X152_COLES|nr:hypothetical protein [Colocasia esculenta]